MVACLNYNKEEIQMKGRNTDVRCLFVFNVYFLVVFNFVLFSVLGADEFFAGKRYADAVMGGGLKVRDDGTSCHRGEGKAIINGCTDGPRELPLQQ